VAVFISRQLRKVIDQTNSEGEAPRDVASPENRGFPGHREAEGTASLTGVYAAQDGEERQGPRQGELPASLPASLIGSL
jgi:hypothetical protein